jgi:triacylglycerol lipase
MRSTSRILGVLTALVVGAGLLTAAPAATAATPPTLAAAGANNWACKPTRVHPSPVVIVHGTFGDSKSLLDRLSRRMHRAGYCVFALDYGQRATRPIEQSAAQLKTFVDKVLDATGAAKVSMVGHSQGGMMPRYYIKFLGGAKKVDDLVGLAPSNHGTTNPLLLFPGLTYLCPACLQQKQGSAFLRRLNSPDETPGPVSYTNIVTRHDEVVLPYSSGYLTGPRTTNVSLQAKCPLDISGHLLIPMDGPAIRLVLDALGRRGPADPAYQPSCLP